jgi:aldehyde:ferredoxin oxidoreductase
MDSLAKYGTAGVVNSQNMYGTLPTFNYNEGQFAQAEAISGEKMAETILKERETCYACVVRCKRVVEITEGAHKVDPYYGGPEYESLGTLGSYCGVGDLAAISEANQICNQNGVDTIACGATIAFAMECYEKGIITDARRAVSTELRRCRLMLAVLNQIVASGPARQGPVPRVQRAAKVWGNSADGA